MKNLTKFILIALMLCFTSLLLQISMAKYRDKVTAPLKSNIAKWDILVNNETINNKSAISNEIKPTFDSNEYVKENVLAPGSEGYFDININATNADVTFDYNIKIEQEDESTLPDLITTGYKINDGTKVEDTNDITGTIQHNTPLTTIRVYIKWDDSENASMNNQQDTEIAINNTNTVMKALITFTQKK